MNFGVKEESRVIYKKTDVTEFFLRVAKIAIISKFADLVKAIKLAGKKLNLHTILQLILNVRGDSSILHFFHSHFILLNFESEFDRETLSFSAAKRPRHIVTRCPTYTILTRI